MGLSILATGISRLPVCVPSEQLDAQLGLSVGTVFRKSGVLTRSFLGPEHLQSFMAADALTAAATQGMIPLRSIDLLLSVSAVSEQALPCTAAAIASYLDLTAGTPAFDINSSCLGFMAGLQVAESLLKTGSYRRIAIVASDVASRGLDWSQPEASLIFGDGAAAVIVEDRPRSGLRAFKLETYPVGLSYCEIRAGGTRRHPSVEVEPKDFLFRMDGKSVFRLASQVLPPLLHQVLQGAHLSLDDIDWIVPHQASHLGMSHLVKRLNLPEAKVVNIYATHGNQVSASLPTAFHHALRTGHVQPGQRILFLGTAAGFTAGVAILEL